MCGIAGFLNYPENLEPFINSVAQIQGHRGPDHHAVWRAEGIALCHQRLSIIDLSEDANSVFAKVILNSEKAQYKNLSLGYSDRVQVFLNGQLLYRGTNRFQSRDYRYLGSIGFFDHIVLPLKQGDNELLLAVSEDFGGWGVSLQVLEGQDVEVVGQR